MLMSRGLWCSDKKCYSNVELQMVTHSEGQFTPWTMEDDVFSMVRLYGPTAIVRILEKLTYKAVGPLITCKPYVDQEEWWMLPQKGSFDNKTNSKFRTFSCLLFPNKTKQIHYNNIYFPRALCLFLPVHLFCFSHRKIHRTMSMDNVGLQLRLSETWNPLINLTFFFPWCEPKWSRDEVHNQSHAVFGEILGYNRLKS